MTEVTCCLLCLNSCSDYKCLCDADGVYDMELYNITVKYFNTRIIIEASKTQLPVVCFKCWQCMSEFHNFQTLIIMIHEKLSKDSLKLCPEADGTQRANRNESLCELEEVKKEFIKKEVPQVDENQPKDPKVSPFGLGLMDEGSIKMEITTEPACISRTDAIADSYIEPNIYVKEEPPEILSSDENSQSVNFNDFDRDREGPQVSKRWKTKKSPRELNEIISKWKSDFECAICKTAVSNFTSLRSHTNQNHPKMKCQISCCQRLHFGASNIAQHAIFHMNPQSFKCHPCSKSFTSPIDLSRHRRRVHSMQNAGSSAASQRMCRICERTFVSKEDWEEHEADHMGVTLYTCLLCSMSFTYRKAMYRHLSTSHPTEWLNRKDTTKSIYTKANLDDVRKWQDLR